jgi:hypothetical protein
LVGKRLFGIQPIKGCDSCTFPNKCEDVEHELVEEILEKYIFVSFFSPKDEYGLWTGNIIKFAKAYLRAKKLGDEKDMMFALDEFIMCYRDFDNFFVVLFNDRTKLKNDNEIEQGLTHATLHPRMWLFVGDSVLTFETYLLFNSDHGNPHMDNWYLVRWKLSQPPATDSFKMICHNIESINVHDNIHNSVDSFIMKADYDEWIEYCGKSDSYQHEVPKEVYYPILEIDAVIKKIELGTKWHVCHYPVSIYNII